ncbi:hypothetical protein EDB85DRAFT_2241680 [Lactarius pseudohatsudake]|nr:hypothetical protein EDB85DRAFT_2241680 [Lactarius pseudohatsudake]
MSMIMRMKGHNGASPCRMCNIRGLRVPDKPGTTRYVPLDRSSHPDVRTDQSGERVEKYDPYNLPLRTHNGLLAQAAEVDAATTITAADRLSKEYGIKGTPLLSSVYSLFFPHSFPYDFMHLIWENTIKNLLLHWTHDFKGLDQGNESYELSKAIWEGIGTLTASSGSTIPSAYGSRVPNIARDRYMCTADMWSFWTLYIGPVLLWRRFKNEKYYKHFILLVKLLTTCLKFEITDEEINTVRNGFVDWVEKYERFYYQHDAGRMSACPVTIHALLHIADSIKTCGPVWCYWAFPMERYCNRLKPAIRNRRSPYSSIDRYILEDAQLTQIKAIYGLADELSLRPQPKNLPQGAYKNPHYPTCILLYPRVVVQQGAGHTSLPTGLSNSIAAALSTRFDVHISVIRQHLQQAKIEEWGKVRWIDSEAGDTIHSSGLRAMRPTADRRDATFVWYMMLVDKFAHMHRRKPKFELQTFYDPQKPIIIAAIRNCKIKTPGPADLEGIDIHLYSTTGSLDLIDITSVQALVGRVEYTVDGGGWAIIDRSGGLARAEWDPAGDADVDEVFNGSDIDVTVINNVRSSHSSNAFVPKSQLLSELEFAIALRQPEKEGVLQNNPYDSVASNHIGILSRLRKLVEMGVSQEELAQLCTGTLVRPNPTNLAPTPAAAAAAVKSPYCAIPAFVHYPIAHTLTYTNSAQQIQAPNTSRPLSNPVVASTASPAIPNISGLFEALVKARVVSATSTPTGAGATIRAQDGSKIQSYDTQPPRESSVEDAHVNRPRRAILAEDVIFSSAETSR